MPLSGRAGARQHETARRVAHARERDRIDDGAIGHAAAAAGGVGGTRYPQRVDNFYAAKGRLTLTYVSRTSRSTWRAGTRTVIVDLAGRSKSKRCDRERDR